VADLDPLPNPEPGRDAGDVTSVAAEMRRAVDEALAGARQELVAAEGRAAARRAQIAGANYSSRTGDDRPEHQPPVGLLRQTIGDLGDSELFAVRHDEELLQFVAAALPGPNAWSAESPAQATTWDVTAEMPVRREEPADDGVQPAPESAWRRSAIMAGLAVLTFIGVIAFLVTP
jgi:hypothetical protein